MGIALSLAVAWLAIAVAWRRLKRVRTSPSPAAPALLASLRSEDLSGRVVIAIRSTSPESWEGALARDVGESMSADLRAAAIDASLAELESALETARAWDRVVPRLAIFGGLLAVCVSVIRGSYVEAVIAAAVGVVAAGVGSAVNRLARSTERLQRERADELASLLAGGRLAVPPPESPGKGLGLDRRRARR